MDERYVNFIIKKTKHVCQMVSLTTLCLLTMQTACSFRMITAVSLAITHRGHNQHSDARQAVYSP